MRDLRKKCRGGTFKSKKDRVSGDLQWYPLKKGAKKVGSAHRTGRGLLGHASDRGKKPRQGRRDFELGNSDSGKSGEAERKTEDREPTVGKNAVGIGNRALPKRHLLRAAEKGPGEAKKNSSKYEDEATSPRLGKDFELWGGDEETSVGKAMPKAEAG